MKYTTDNFAGTPSVIAIFEDESVEFLTAERCAFLLNDLTQRLEHEALTAVVGTSQALIAERVSMPKKCTNPIESSACVVADILAMK